MMKSIWAVAAGVLFIVIVTTLVDIALHMADVFPPANQPLTDPLADLAVEVDVVAEVVASAVASSLAPATARACGRGGLYGRRERSASYWSQMFVIRADSGIACTCGMPSCDASSR